jgi:hypothetical protein
MKIALGGLCGLVRARCHGLLPGGRGWLRPLLAGVPLRRVGTGAHPLMAGYLTAVTLWMMTA